MKIYIIKSKYPSHPPLPTPHYPPLPPPLINKTNKEIIELVSEIIKPKFTFNIYDFTTRGDVPYLKIEELNVLHFKFDGRKYGIYGHERNELIEKIKKLELNNIHSVEIIKYDSIGLFIKIVLQKLDEIIIAKYNGYQEYRNAHYKEIDKTYCYLNKKIPKEFVGWFLFDTCEKIKYR